MEIIQVTRQLYDLQTVSVRLLLFMKTSVVAQLIKVNQPTTDNTDVTKEKY